MTILKAGLSWKEAVAILYAGGVVNRPHWNEGADRTPCAIVRVESGALVIVDHLGMPLEAFKDPPETFDAAPWQQVQLDPVLGSMP